MIDIVAKQVSTCVEKKYKIVIHLLIASAVYSEIKWDLLFDKSIHIETPDEQEKLNIVMNKLEISRH